MRILADENCPGDLVTALRSDGYDVVWIRMDAPDSNDPAILTRAQAERRIILTFDKDFGELAFR
jgi:predicted nuclease of predicted toxin-antitoxin system